MQVLDLFSGIGGFSLGLERAGMHTAAFCEIDPFCQKILAAHWHNTPLYDDIKSLSKERLENDGIKQIDLICGGFPCQPFSVAGKKKGGDDSRDLWPEMFRIIQEIKPRWVIGENVANFVNMELERTCLDLEAEGYEVQPFIIPACAVQAPHRRDRVWIIAHAQSERHGGRRANKDSHLREWEFCQNQCDHRDTIRGETASSDELCGSSANGNGKRSHGCKHHRQERSVLQNQERNITQNQPIGNGRHSGAISHDGDIADTHSNGIQRLWQEKIQGIRAFQRFENVRGIEDYFNRPDIPKPLICRGDDGFSTRVERLKSLGNAVVPQIPEILGHIVMEVENS